MPRKESPFPQHPDAAPPGFPATVRWVGETTWSDFVRAASAKLAGARRAGDGGPVNILVLSGGGSGAAFGAGVLIGWSGTGTRPPFQIVTGVSGGALIAPLAFLGPRWDGELQKAFSGRSSRGLMQTRSLGWLGSLFSISAFRGKPLEDLVNGFVTDDLLRAVAAEAEKGRLLLVATTDLDTEQLVVWDMGAIAAHGGAAARQLFRDVLVASASVPGVFPPVLIRVGAASKTFDEMHVDGGTTTPFLFAPEVVSIMPVTLSSLHGGNIYVIVNGQLRDADETTPVRTVSILKRSVAAGLNSDVRARVELAYTFAQKQAMRLHITEVPVDYPLPSPLDMNPSSMRALFEYGERCAADRQIWSDAVDVLDVVAQQGAPPPNGFAPCPADEIVLAGRATQARKPPAARHSIDP